MRNKRLVLAGGLALVLAGGFFLFMMTLASKSTDPVELMKTVGQVSGVVGGIGVAMIVFGLFGKPKAGA